MDGGCPGARSGIRKCFADTAGLDDADVIRAVADMADREFDRLGLSFRTLWGRPLQLIDCQNLFCEVDKYARIVHPAFSGIAGRTRIKQRFTPKPKRMPQWYPPKWDLKALERDINQPLESSSHTSKQGALAFNGRAERIL